jgi:AmmeMemoRadiSam system protein B
MSADDRTPWCAGRFYPADPQVLATMLDDLLVAPDERPAVALVAPHAGYVYSGGVAGRVFASAPIPRHVVLVGPKHTRDGAPLACVTGGAWALPTGRVPVATDLARRLMAAVPALADDPRAHAREHCLEVELPFLLRRQPDLRFVPIVVAGLGVEGCRDLGLRLADVVAAFTEPVLLVASTDMHHQGSEDLAPGERTDAVVHARSVLALDRLDAFDPAGMLRVCRLHDVTMCGVVPTAVALEAARALGADRVERLAFTDSHAVRGGRGESDYTVGYAGYRVSRGSGNA